MTKTEKTTQNIQNGQIPPKRLASLPYQKTRYFGGTQKRRYFRGFKVPTQKGNIWVWCRQKRPFMHANSHMECINEPNRRNHVLGSQKQNEKKDPKYQKVPKSQKYPKMAISGGPQKVPKNGQNGQKWPKMAKNGPQKTPAP